MLNLQDSFNDFGEINIKQEKLAVRYENPMNPLDISAEDVVITPYQKEQDKDHIFKKNSNYFSVRSWIIISLLTVLFIAIIIAGYFFFMQKRNTNTAKILPKLEPPINETVKTETVLSPISEPIKPSLPPKPSISIDEAKTPEITGDVPAGWKIKPDSKQMITLVLSGMEVSAPVYKLVPKNAQYLVEPVGSEGMTLSLTKCIDSMNTTAKSLSVLATAYSQTMASKQSNQQDKPQIGEQSSLQSPQ